LQPCNQQHKKLPRLVAEEKKAYILRQKKMILFIDDKEAPAE
jgi:hypothetical protein